MSQPSGLDFSAPPPRPKGVFLSLGRLILVILIVILLMGASFVGGMIVGKTYFQADTVSEPPESSPQKVEKNAE